MVETQSQVAWSHACSCSCRYLLEQANVAAVPGDAFGVPSCIRLSYAASLPALQQACRRLQHALAPDKFEGRS